VSHYHLSEIPVDAKRFLDASALPDHHADPFDRLILAAAMYESASVVTYDRLFDAYQVSVLS
jgi:PIN domain nuclease of toxin-antitoxin system